MEGLRASSAERDDEQKDLESERVSLTLRVEKAEAQSIASNNEMLEVSRRCAREIAGLRAKLAEKDAQLMVRVVQNTTWVGPSRSQGFFLFSTFFVLSTN